MSSKDIFPKKDASVSATVICNFLDTVATDDVDEVNWSRSDGVNMTLKKNVELELLLLLHSMVLA